ncbi:MAG: hypothetical protein ABSH31_01995 [Bryobacteraceae bacterium]|jgi:hypothetical protein
MIQARSLSLILGAAALLLAADPDWKTKTIADWSEADAHQVLENSPWAKVVVAGVARRRSEDELREGGQMGQPKGVGYDGVEDKKRSLKEEIGNPLVPGKPLPSTAPTIRLLVRWESALPVRVAELKAHEPPPPVLSDDGYVIAVYGVPASFAKGDPTSLGKPLKESAALKREGKKDIPPSRVEVFELENSVVVAFLFPLSAEIGKRDGVVEFSALIGRLQVSQHFLVEAMQFQGKLEL